MSFDDTRHEYERLINLGRKPLSEPTAREALTARMLDPSAWSVHAEEHIAWCKHYGHTGFCGDFGGQFLLKRSLAHMKAIDLLRHLDRQAAGKADVQRFDAHALGKQLEKQSFDLSRQDHRQYVSHKAAKAVWFMNKANGIPAPEAKMAKDGAVTLTWSEEDRNATIEIDAAGDAKIALKPSMADAIAVDFQRWNSNACRLLAEATDWVHFDGPLPSFANGQPEAAEAA